MPSNKRVIVLILFSFFFSGCIQSQSNLLNKNLIKKDFKYKTFADEDRYIMFALEYDRQGMKEESRELFLKLYSQTLKEEYLFEYIRGSFALKKYDDIILNVEKNRKEIKKDENKILKIYILALLNKKDYKKAEEAANELIKKEDVDVNYELLGTILLQKEEYIKAKELFNKVYKNSSSINSLLNLTNIMYVYLDEKKEAINLLEAYTKVNDCNNLVCSKLLSFYSRREKYRWCYLCIEKKHLIA